MAIKARFKPKFPTRMLGTNGVDVTKVGGVVTVQLDTDELADIIAAELAEIGANIPAPKVSRYVLGRGQHPVTTGCTLMLVEMVGGGGGGSGNRATNEIPTEQYGDRGGDSGWSTTGPLTITITSGTPATFNRTNHGLVAGTPLWFATTGALPPEITAGTAFTGSVYYVMSTGLTADAFRVSAEPSSPNVIQTAVNATNTGSGIITVEAYVYVTQGGGGGGVIGDQGTPLSYIGFDSADPTAGYVTSWGIQGGAGGAIYGQDVGSGAGGVTALGGSSGESLNDFGISGANQTGAGGGGAGATTTSSGGTGGASGSFGRLWMKPPVSGVVSYMVGAGGDGGIAGSQTVTFTDGSPDRVNLTAHGMLGGEQIQFVGTLPTGVSTGTTYYVVRPPLSSDTFEISATLNGSAVTFTGSGTGTISMTSGFVGGDGGTGMVTVTEFFGLV